MKKKVIKKFFEQKLCIPFHKLCVSVNMDQKKNTTTK